MITEADLVKRLVEARQNNTPISLIEAIKLTPLSAHGAYQAQAQVADALGWFDQEKPSVWKLGGPRGASTAAALPGSVVKHHPAGKPVILQASDACTFTGIELELAVRLKAPLLPGATLADAIDAVGETWLALEICDERAEQWQALPELFRLADHQMNRGLLLLGEPLSGWQATLDSIAPTIRQGDSLISSGPLQHPQQHPLGALPWLANLSQALYSQPLAAGTLIATGTWAGMQIIEPGAPFTALLGQFPTAEVQLSETSDPSFQE